MPRKTINVARIVERANTMMRTPDSTLSVASMPGLTTDGVHHIGDSLTLEQAFRLGVASITETILHETGNYHGYGYSDGNLGRTDPTRRRYS